MNRFKNILFVADGTAQSSPALERAVTLAENNHAKLTVVDVIETITDADNVQARFGVSLNDLLHDHRLKALKELVTPYQSTEHSVYTRVLMGTAFAEIIRTVIQNDHDLVIKAIRAPANLGERLLGSTDLHLLRKCPCPVWIDRPSKTMPYKKILAAVDPMGDKSVAVRVLQLATSLAEREQAKLEVVHAWRLPGESVLLKGHARVSVTEVNLFLAEQEKMHAEKFNVLLSNFELSIANDNVHFVKGDTAPRVLEYGADADLIVMGTIGRAGIPGFIIGNTAEEVMQMASSSILAVKPDGYVSPLA